MINKQKRRILSRTGELWRNLLRLILPQTRVSHPISKALRPVFENKHIRSALGGLLVMTTFILGISLYPPREPIRAIRKLDGLILKTEGLRINPLPKTTGISQGYHVFHRAIDLTAPATASIRAIDKGVVEIVNHSNYGYGRCVIILHDDNLRSLYAHMGKIFVEEGEEVRPGSILGEVGLTGRTSGYHLHFEIRRGNLTINPLPYLYSRENWKR